MVKAGGGREAGRHVGGALFVSVPAEMTGRWTAPAPTTCLPRPRHLDTSSGHLYCFTYRLHFLSFKHSAFDSQSIGEKFVKYVDCLYAL